MSLTPGVRLDVYEVVARIGQGGMGEVFHARDTRLHRDVALKVLPDAFAADADRLARFEREALALAALNHPHVAQIYGVVDVPSTTGGPAVRALIMELVSGDDLAQRIARGPIPIGDALPIAAQIADALHAAHERGVVHRDLKPANVKLSDEGGAKVLDFGLARPPGASATDATSANTPTFTSPAMTLQGVILGTAAYMSPEQARGKLVDHRTDIWSFGCLLYEMLTGRPAFQGETITDVLAAIITRPPDWSALPPHTPAPIRRLLERCVTTDLRRRLGDAGEARAQIEDVIANPAPAAHDSAAVTTRSSKRASLPWAIAGVLAAILGVVVWQLRGRDTGGSIRYTVDLPPGATLSITTRPVIAISADGRAIAFVASASGTSRIHLRRQDAFESQPLAGTEGASEPVFSPDGRWLAFFANNQLSRIRVEGGPIDVLAKVSDPRGLSWDSHGLITYSPESVGGVYQIPVDPPGPPVAISKLQGDERTHRWPQALPGNQAVLFTVGGLTNPDNYDNANIEAVVVATGERRVVMRGAAMARYVAPGYLLYVRERIVFAVGFDADRLEVQGTPAAVIPGVSGDVTTGASNLGVAGNGTLVFIPGSAEGMRHRIAWVDRTGAATPIDLVPGAHFDPRVSPDGARVALQSVGAGSSNIWIHDFARKTFTRLSFVGAHRTPVWSPDGKTVYYILRDPTSKGTSLMRKPSDGSGTEERVATTEHLLFLAGISGDGRTAFVEYVKSGGKTDIGMMPLDKTGPIVPIVETPFDEYASRVSPNGRWLAYQSDETSRHEIYVRDLQGSGRWQISTTGGEEPRWSPDGRELYFRNDTEFLAAAVQSEGTFQNTAPRVLFARAYNLRAESGISYDVDPKTGRLLMIRLADDSIPPASIRVATNWLRELARQRE
jgi:serine/threonine-protein kinase